MNKAGITKDRDEGNHTYGTKPATQRQGKIKYLDKEMSLIRRANIKRKALMPEYASPGWSDWTTTGRASAMNSSSGLSNDFHLRDE